MIVKVSETNPSHQKEAQGINLFFDESNGLLLRRKRNLIENKSSEIQFLSISNLSTTNNYLRLKLLVKGDGLTIRMYH